MNDFTQQDFQGAFARINQALAEPVAQATAKFIDTVESTTRAQLDSAVGGMRAVEKTLVPLAAAKNPAEAYAVFEGLTQQLGQLQQRASDDAVKQANAQIAEGFALADQLVEAGTTVLRESLDLTVGLSEATLGQAFRTVDRFTQPTAKAA